MRDEIISINSYLHNEQVCFGRGASGYLEDGSMLPFTLTSGALANTFGVAVQIYNGSYGADYKFVLDKLFVVNALRYDYTYLVEFWAGATTFAAATRITSVIYRTGVESAECVPLPARSPKVRCDQKIWARVKCTYAAASWLELLFAAHFHPGIVEFP
jgi:hypothetical protein